MKAALLDWTGVALAGSRRRSARAVAALVEAERGRPAVSVFGRAFRAPAAGAALANGTAGHAELFDDNSVPMIAHPSACVVPAVVALAQERRATGGDVVAAYAAGFEVEVKLGRWLNPGHYDAGWHATGVLGTVGAAAAAARVLRLDPDRTLMALGIAASFASGIRRNFGTMTMGLHAGHAARSGVNAALLAGEGFESDPEALDGPYGFGPLFGGREPGPCPGEPGSPLELTASGILFKPFPCGAPTHAAIDAVIGLREEHGVRAGDVERITCEVHPWTFKALRPGLPRDGLGGKVSMEYCVARALLHGGVELEHFDDAAVADPAAVAVMRRVTVTTGGGLPDNGEFPARVTLLLADGRRLTRQVDHPPGSPGRPLSRDELEAKFARCARGLIDPASASAYAARLRALEREPDVEPLFRLLEGAERR